MWQAWYWEEGGVPHERFSPKKSAVQELRALDSVAETFALNSEFQTSCRRLNTPLVTCIFANHKTVDLYWRSRPFIFISDGGKGSGVRLALASYPGRGSFSQSDRRSQRAWYYLHAHVLHYYIFHSPLCHESAITITWCKWLLFRWFCCVCSYYKSPHSSVRVATH